MKKAKLQKLLLQAKEAHTRKAAALKNLSQNVVDARSEFTRSKVELKTARKQHKEIRKRLRKLEKALKITHADRQVAQESFARLDKKWRKLNQGGKKAETQTAPRPPRKAFKKAAPRKKAQKTPIKVVAPSAAPQEVVAAT